MGTRDIYISLVIVILFTVITEYLCNEESHMCCLSDDFKSIIWIVDENISDDDIKKAKEVLAKAEKMEKEKTNELVSSNNDLNETLYRL